MHPDVKPATDSIWAPWRFNLGDHWQTINYLLTRSFVLREEMLLSKWQHGKDCSKRFTEILALIKGPERSCVTLVNGAGDHEPDGFDVWAAPSWPTHETWQAPLAMNNGVVTYQFDGVSSAEEKNPSRDDQARMITEMNHGLNVSRVKRLGSDSTLAECVEQMRKSLLFVGCDSGMSHIAHAVGVPTIIVEYGLPIITCHRGKHYMHARGTDEAVKLIEKLLR